MAKGQLEAGWFVNCGANMCRNKEAAPGSPLAVEKHLAAKGWLRSAALGWLCPACSKNSQYVLRRG